MAQAITMQAQASTTKAQAMTSQDNWEIIPQANQIVISIASHLSDLTRMNPPSFYGSKVEEHPLEFIYEIYKILYVMEFI